jgi:hypothetical protein
MSRRQRAGVSAIGINLGLASLRAHTYRHNSHADGRAVCPARRTDRQLGLSNPLRAGLDSCRFPKSNEHLSRAERSGFPETAHVRGARRGLLRVSVRSTSVRRLGARRDKWSWGCTMTIRTKACGAGAIDVRLGCEINSVEFILFEHPSRARWDSGNSNPLCGSRAALGPRNLPAGDLRRNHIYIVEQSRAHQIFDQVHRGKYVGK